MQNLCNLGAGVLAGSCWDDPTSFRLSLAEDGRPVGQMAGVSTFLETTTVAEASCVKIPDDIPLEVACLVGCGVGTGWGSAVNSGGVQPGRTTIVMAIGAADGRNPVNVTGHQ